MADVLSSLGHVVSPRGQRPLPAMMFDVCSLYNGPKQEGQRRSFLFVCLLNFLFLVIMLVLRSVVVVGGKGNDRIRQVELPTLPSDTWSDKAESLTFSASIKRIFQSEQSGLWESEGWSVWGGGGGGCAWRGMSAPLDTSHNVQHTLLRKNECPGKALFHRLTPRWIM